MYMDESLQVDLEWRLDRDVQYSGGSGGGSCSNVADVAPLVHC